MRPFTISVNPTRSTDYERWASRLTGILIMQVSEINSDYESALDFEDTSPFTVINKQTEQSLLEQTATLDVQALETEMLRLYFVSEEFRNL